MWVASRYEPGLHSWGEACQHSPSYCPARILVDPYLQEFKLCCKVQGCHSKIQMADIMSFATKMS